MSNFFQRLFETKRTEAQVKVSAPVSSVVEAIEEHRIQLPGLDIAVSHGLKAVFIVDQTGSASDSALQDLESFLNLKGYHLHCVVVQVDKTMRGN